MLTQSGRKRFNHFLAKNPQCFGSVCGHEDTFTLGEQVAEQVGNRVRLSSAGWPLNEDAILPGELLGDFELFLIGGLAHQNIFVFVAKAKSTSDGSAWKVGAQSARPRICNNAGEKSMRLTMSLKIASKIFPDLCGAGA